MIFEVLSTAGELHLINLKSLIVVLKSIYFKFSLKFDYSVFHFLNFD